jgi:rhodanese-related sulfurtransferase
MSRIAARTIVSAQIISRSIRPTVLPTFRATLPSSSSTSPAFLFRHKSTDTAAWGKNTVVTYDELKPITQQPNDVRFSPLSHMVCIINQQEILIMDVREPDEVALGSIPSAVSLPLSQLREALDKNFSPGEFQKVSSRCPAQEIQLTVAEIRVLKAPPFSKHHLLLPVWQTVGHSLRMGAREGVQQDQELSGKLAGLEQAREGVGRR